MPVFKYKTFAEAKQALWNFRTDSTYFKQVADLWAIAGELCPLGYPHGVFKYRSLEEANEERKQWDVSNALKMRSQGTGSEVGSRRTEVKDRRSEVRGQQRSSPVE